MKTLTNRHTITASRGEFELLRIEADYFVFVRFRDSESRAMNEYRAGNIAREWLGSSWRVIEYVGGAIKDGKHYRRYRINGVRGEH